MEIRRHRVRKTLTFVAIIACLALAHPSAAQTPVGPFEKVQVTAGHSIVLPTEFDVTRIAVTNPAIADANVVTPREILIDGKTAGTISLIVWGDGRRVQYELIV